MVVCYPSTEKLTSIHKVQKSTGIFINFITKQLQSENFLVSYNYFRQSVRTEVICVLFMGVPGVQSLAAPQGMMKSKTNNMNIQQ